METRYEVEHFTLSYFLCEKSNVKDENFSNSKFGAKMKACKIKLCKNHIYPGGAADGLTNRLIRDIESKYGCGETFILSVKWLKIHPGWYQSLDIQNPVGG